MQIVYILGTFPCITETFIHNEIVELQQSGLQIKVYAVDGRSVSSNRSDLENVKVNYFNGYFTLKNLITHIYLIKAIKFRYLTTFFKVFFRKNVSLFSVGRNLKAFSIAASFLYDLRDDEVARIHSHFISFPTSIALLMSQLSGIPFSCTAHANDIYMGNPEDIAYKIRKSQFVVTCTSANKDHLMSLCSPKLQSKIVHIYHGINLKEWPLKCIYSNKRTFNIVTVARLVEKKGLKYLLDAVEILRYEQVSDIHCTVIGDGPLRKELEQRVVSKQMEHLISFRGILDHCQIKEIYQQSDCFVLPCVVSSDGDRDGLPNVLLEAMSVGLPVVTTSISAIPELIEHEETGLLVSEKNPRQIAYSIKRLKTEPEFYSRLVANALKKIRSFNILDSTIQLKGLFERAN